MSFTSQQDTICLLLLHHTTNLLVHVFYLFQVWGHSVTGDETKLGHVVLGVAAGGSGSVQWIRMVKNTGFPSIIWHKLVADGDEESATTG